MYCGVYFEVERNERMKEVVAVLMCDLCHRSMMKYVWGNSRIILVKFKFEKIKVCVAVWHIAHLRKVRT